MGIGNSKEFSTLSRAITLTFIAIAGILIQDGSVWAIHMELLPSLTWQIYYEDNIAGVPQNQPGKISGFSNRYVPGLRFVVTSSKFSIAGETKLRVNRYLSERDWDKTDREYNITGIYKLNHRSELTLSALYTLNSDPERYLITDAQGLQAGVLVRNSQDEVKSYMVNYKYGLSPRNNLLFMFSYNTFFTSQYNNGGDIYIYNASFVHNLSKKDELTITLGYNKLQFNYGIAEAADLGFKLDTYSISGGIIHEFSNSLKLKFNVGWYISETKQRQAVFEQNPDTGETILTGIKTVNNSTPGSNFLFTVEKKYFHTFIGFRASQTLATNPDTGQTYPSTNIDISISHDFSEKWQGYLSGAYYNNKASAGDYNNRTKIDDNTYSSSLGLSYKYRQNITFTVQYQWIESEYGTPRHNTIRNIAFLQCTVALQRPFIVR